MSVDVRTVDLGQTKKDRIRVMIAQPVWEPAAWIEEHGRYSLVEDSIAQKWVNGFLQIAREGQCDLVVLPELSVPESLLGVITGWSAQTGSIVVAGSHYHKTEGGFIARCPVVIGNRVSYVGKVYPAPAEKSPIPGGGITTNHDILRFVNTTVGNFGVLICSDYLVDTMKSLIDLNTLDALCIPAFQVDSGVYHKRIDIDIENAANGLYVLYANSFMSNFGDGRSAIFGLTDKLYRKALADSNGTTDSISSRPVQLRSSEHFCIAELDLHYKRPQIPRTVSSSPNVTIISRGRLEVENGGPSEVIIAKSTKGSILANFTNASDISTHIYEQVKKLVARHGLDDEDWATAFSSVYFLSQLAELLGRENSRDYQNLLNKFLKYFRFQADDTIALIEDQILVTPRENEQIRKAMEEEDRGDPYFVVTAKTKVENVDMQLMHENYLYGVALGVSAKRKTRVLRTIKDTAIHHLVLDDSRMIRDPNGGWSPYRVPWITARILVSLSKVDAQTTQDAEKIAQVTHDALESLLQRLDTSGYWRSGVGTWVSTWECTALCLEAFLVADTTGKYEAVVTAVVKSVIDNANEWMVEKPDFSSEEAANNTLASVLMASVLLRLCTRYENQRNLLAPELATRLFEILLATLNVIVLPKDFHQRQFCTIPQIAAYCASVCEG